MAKTSLSLRTAALAGLMVLSAGCTTQVHRVPVDSARLVVSVDERLACAHHLREVVDARPTSERAGGLGSHMFLFDDVPGLVRQQFAQAGLTDQGQGPAVDVRVMQFYLAQNQVTKIPVAVYEVRVDGGAPILVRSQQASTNWWGSEDEAYAAYSTALADATGKVVTGLNASCPKAG